MKGMRLYVFMVLMVSFIIGGGLTLGAMKYNVLAIVTNILLIMVLVTLLILGNLVFVDNTTKQELADDIGPAGKLYTCVVNGTKVMVYDKTTCDQVLNIL